MLVGRSANGWLEWKSADGHPLSDYLDQVWWGPQPGLAGARFQRLRPRPRPAAVAARGAGNTPGPAPAARLRPIGT
ncbi:DUF4357 domain-containing protein [Streptomyces sparsogenes]|uniref:DUF4357 domain-containing protein n=1 Tax=Streptomyces sparsogenes TaxID=67365 RepID=UPI001FE05A86|nr:DUF4357 domain-containing protein [Streptomyces sparsogenes]